MGSPVRLAVAALAAAAMIGGVAAPVAAQETLGFEIDPTEGFPGEIVNGQVNVADVAAHCTTDLEEFMARFQELAFDVLQFSPTVTPPLWHRFWPEDTMNLFEIENHDQLAYTLTLFVAIGLSGGLSGDDEDAAAEALPQTFVMTFADVATQEPVGELSNFDPDTGVGSVVVPDVDPGLWAVAAACVGPTLDPDVLEAGIRASGAFLQELGVPAVNPLSPEFEEWAQEFLDSEATGLALVIEFVTAIGPDLVQNIVEPDALGFELFTVLSDEEEVVDEEVDEAEAARAVAKAVAKVTIDISIHVDGDALRAKADELVGVDVVTATAPAAQAVEAAPTFTG
jgi:hypothetical protein